VPDRRRRALAGDRGRELAIPKLAALHDCVHRSAAPRTGGSKHPHAHNAAADRDVREAGQAVPRIDEICR
jgi:hypothetical protein